MDRLRPVALVMLKRRQVATVICSREALMMGCQRTAQRDWARERNDCCGLLRNNRHLPLGSELARVAVVEQVGVPSQHWIRI